MIYIHSAAYFYLEIKSSVSILRHDDPPQHGCHRSGRCPPRLEAQRPSDLPMDMAVWFLNIVSEDLPPVTDRRPWRGHSKILVLSTMSLWSEKYCGPQIRPIFAQFCWCYQLPTRNLSRPRNQARLRHAMPKPNHPFAGLRRGPNCQHAHRSQPIRSASQRNGSDRHLMSVSTAAGLVLNIRDFGCCQQPG